MDENRAFTYEDIIGYAILIERRGIALYAEAAEAVKMNLAEISCFILQNRKGSMKILYAASEGSKF